MYIYGRPVKIDRVKDIDTLREKYNLPSIHTNEDCIYVLLTRNDSGSGYDVSSLKLYAPNAYIYYDRQDELIDSDKSYERSEEASFITNELDFHQQLINNFREAFWGQKNFYFTNQKSDTIYLRLYNLTAYTIKDYLGEIIFKSDHKSEEVSREDIPKRILKEFDAEQSEEKSEEFDDLEM